MRRLLFAGALLAALVVTVPSLATLANAPPSPVGVTAMAKPGAVELAWEPTSGASAYTVFRGTTPGAVTTLVSPAEGVTSTSFSDTSVSNGTTYYYTLRALAGPETSPASFVVSSTPRVRSCSSGNQVVMENCISGDSDWNISNTVPPAEGGIEGFATRTSVNKGDSFQVKVSTVQGAPFRIEIFRMGYYGGAGARLFSTIHDLPGVLQPSCVTDAPTGLLDCSNWSVSATITTTDSWPSGVYLLRLARETGGAENHVMVIVRDDGSHSDLLYGVAYSDYQAYNYYGGKSLYDGPSSGESTVSGARRAVKVSFDRPLEITHRDRFVIEEVPVLSWLEHNGYDVSYISNTDLDASGAQVRNHLAYVMQGHDEYWSEGMRTALEQGRDAGTSLFSMGGNQVYWKVRFEPSPVSGAAGRVMVCYKSSQSGPPDPSGIPTGTWRDPAGANNPENALLGNMYVGDNDSQNFPLRVSQAEGDDPFWRHTSLASMTTPFTDVGEALVGWEWDAPNANGFGPPDISVLSSSPVSGELVQNAGANYTQGSAVAHAVRYVAPSGALVIAVGTNFWKRGLGLDGRGEGEPDLRIQQATTNGFADMGVMPTTPAPGIVLDSVGIPSVTTMSPTEASSGVLPGVSVSATFSTAIAPASVTTASFTLRRPDNSIVPATVNYVGGSKMAVLSPSSPLSLATVYTAKLETSITSADGTPLASPVAWSFTTTLTPPPPPSVIATSPPGSALDVARDTRVTATFDHTMAPSTINSSSFTLRAADGSLVPSVVTFDALTKTATLTPADRLAATATYTAGLEATIRDSDGLPLAAPVSWGFTTNASMCPCTLFSPTQFPSNLGLPTNDGHGSPTYELGVKIQVNTPTLIEGIRFWKSASETGTHVGRVWTASGVELAQVPFVGETGSGWQQQLLAAPLALQANTTYVVSVGLNTSYGVTPAGLATPMASGPLVTVADGQNGVFGSSAGTFPASSFNNGNYFIDVRATLAAGAPLTVSSTVPVAGAAGVSLNATVRATFSRDVDAASVTGSSFVLKRADGTSVPAGVSYDVVSRTATLTPVGVLATSAVYTARLETSIMSPDGTPLASPFSWSFTSAASPPVAPTVTGVVPVEGAVDVDRGSVVTATFSRAMDAATITSLSFVLLRPDGTSVPASVVYDAGTQSATLTPTSALAMSTVYAARLETMVRAADGTPLAAPVSWGFTTNASMCPCTLFSPTQFPSNLGLPTNDGHGSPTYELGVKIQVNTPTLIEGIRFWKSASETGTHVGRVWTASGVELAQVPFVGETGSGWQQQLLAAPLALQANTTYVVSVGLNTSYGVTPAGLATPMASGPLVTVADGQNGVFGSSAGTFPASSFNNGNYFIDVRATLAAGAPLTVSSTVPVAGAAGVSLNATVRATFSRDVDAASVTGSSFVLKRADGTSVPAGVSYDVVSRTATLTPVGVLATSAVYTARLETSIMSPDGTPLASPFSWSFTSAASPPVAPTVTGVVPVEGAVDVDRGSVVTATFSRAMDAATITSLSFVLLRPDGTSVPASVVYDAGTQSATLTPTSALAMSTVYAARLETMVRAADGTPLAAPVSWGFTTNASMCPCTLFSPVQQPSQVSLDTRDGRGGTGPWSYELGVKVRVSQPMELRAIRFWKSASETGTHVGRVWTASGVELAQVPFVGETGSGWQQQLLAAPLALQANTTYVVSVGLNAFFSVTPAGLATQIDSGPLSSVADGQNGVFGSSAGTFPASSFNNSNYFIDAKIASVSVPDTMPPDATVTTPGAGDWVGGSVNVSAVASDDVGVAGVQFRLDGVALGAEDTVSPFAVSWDTAAVSNGSHVLTAVARDPAGNTTTSVSVTVTVDNEAPMVSISTPVTGSQFTGSQPVNVDAVAADNGTVAGVQFKLDGINLGAEDTAAPYSFAWNLSSVAGGVHVLTAVARDEAGNVTTSGPVSVTVDKSAPTVSVSSPAGGAAVMGSVSVAALASDDVGVAGVQFRLDGVALGAEDTVSPFAVSWDTAAVSNGSHVLTAVARDPAGNTTTSVSVTVTVDNEAPMVSISTPVTGSQFTGSQPVNVDAVAADNGTVAGVQFKLDGINLGAEDTAAPYSFAWNLSSVAGGVHVLTAVARDEAGNVTTSGPVSVTVDKSAPTVSVSSPAGGAAVMGSVSVAALASDDVGVAGVQFRLDGVALGAEDTVSPFAVSWDTAAVSNGSHVLTAVARDPAGNTTTSVSVTVTVDNEAPVVSLSAPAAGAVLRASVSITATASDNRSVVGVQFKLDGNNVGAEDTSSPYAVSWNTTSASNGPHVLTAVARDPAGNSTTSPSVALTVDNQTPTVSITAPPAGSLVRAITSVTALASDDHTVASVQFRVDGNNVGALVTAAPYTIAWSTTTATNGSHLLSAVARDAAGNATTSSSVSVIVDNSAPTASLTAPANNASVRGSIQVTASATDNRALVGVQFKLDGNNLGAEDTSSPFAISWDTLTATDGTHALTAVARDTAGNTTTSATRTVTIDNTAPVPVAAFTATPESTNVALSWILPVDPALSRVRIMRKQGVAPTSPTDGTAVFNTLGTAATDTLPPAGAAYVYAAYLYDVAGNVSTQAIAQAVAPAPNDVYSSFTTAGGCAACTNSVTSSGLTVTIGAAADNRDTAYGTRDFGASAGFFGRVYVRTALLVPAGQTTTANLWVFQVRDTGNRVVYELYLRSDRTIWLSSPAGGLQATAIDAPTGVQMPTDGVTERVVEVSALVNDSVIVRIDGVDRIAITGLAGSTSTNQRYLRVGIDRYDGSSTTGAQVRHRAVTISQAGWLGPPPP